MSFKPYPRDPQPINWSKTISHGSTISLFCVPILTVAAIWFESWKIFGTAAVISLFTVFLTSMEKEKDLKKNKTRSRF